MLKARNIAENCVTALLSYFYIILREMELENISLSDISSFSIVFLTLWLPMISILFVIVRIPTTNSNTVILKNKNMFVNFLLHF